MSRNAYIDAFKKEKYDRIVLNLPKGSKDYLKSQALIMDKKSVTELIRDAIEVYCGINLNNLTTEVSVDV